MKIMDCTLRDGANVVGSGFSEEMTRMITEGLIASGINIIEIGHATGLGSMKNGGKSAPVTDEGYMEAVQPYVERAEIGMFQLARNVDEELIHLAAQKKLSFLRVGANAGDGKSAERAIKCVRDAGLAAKYSMMKAYVLTPDELAEEAALLESYGVQAITIMDSAGFMFPTQAAEYTEKMVAAVSVPVGFHGHSNLGMAQANAIAAARAGAGFIDCGLMGMARSAGNITTEGIIAAFQRQGACMEYDLYRLLSFIDDKLIPAMAAYGFHAPVTPLDLVLGWSGCHSSFLPLFREAAQEKHVDLYRLVMEVSAIDQKMPTRALIWSTAEKLAG